ncbi:MAG TPA: CBS domain-containing protein [Piscinibacter sp.]|jgi:CBS-domain-containing membrane protein|uniref:CBS domain-containing protein n=1 Tax=Piscinibacter sp. TaxID=1903157 RepID=UPI001D326E94|nr:CBS domain-containing protein [Piscinibacter sp.]MBK7531971.1 CBS domain-containing protein [Piscinibacter sp.]MBL0093737.1 CBS domain-containing protein [Piscinibacter sp.]HPG77899.1 CBS domain-containing protein [Piscinibacter sp.]HPM66490.1 CBS domain-containing protein [Piscinibacter sp.]
MFHIHGVQGRVFSGTLEQLRQQQLVTGVARIRRVASVATETSSTTAAPSGGGGGSELGPGAEAVQAYGQATRVRRPLTCAADVMHSPALTVPADATLREAWQVLARHGIAQAPVVGAGGVLVGLVGRIELMPAASLEPPSAASESARLSQPVTTVMWSPVPSTAPGTDLRRVAALLLHTGLPGVPVAADDGGVLGFVSRTDLLRALTTDPPLDLWG